MCIFRQAVFHVLLIIYYLSDCAISVNQNENEEAYGFRQSNNTELDSRWGGPQETDLRSKMCISLPKKFEPGDTFTVSGPISYDIPKLSCLLMKGCGTPDYNNVVLLFEANFPTSGTGNFMIVQVIKNGVAETVPGDYQNYQTTEYFATGSTYEFSFKTRLLDSGRYLLSLIVNGEELEDITIDLEDLEAIKFISIIGEPIKKFQYVFAD